MPRLILKPENLDDLRDLLRTLEANPSLPARSQDAARQWLTLLGYAKNYPAFSVAIEETPAKDPAC